LAKPQTPEKFPLEGTYVEQIIGPRIQQLVREHSPKSITELRRLFISHCNSGPDPSDAVFRRWLRMLHVDAVRTTTFNVPPGGTPPEPAQPETPMRTIARRAQPTTLVPMNPMSEQELEELANEDSDAPLTPLGQRGTGQSIPTGILNLLNYDPGTVEAPVRNHTAPL
jgi:hypothetical protein